VQNTQEADKQKNGIGKGIKARTFDKVISIHKGLYSMEVTQKKTAEGEKLDRSPARV